MNLMLYLKELEKKEKLSLVFVKERNNNDQRRNKWMGL